MDIFAFTVFAFSSLFAMIDPLGCIPFYSGLTSHMGDAQKRRVLAKALGVALFVLLLFTWFGRELLELFGITVDAFRIAGGVIFFGIGLDMLQSRPRRWRTGIRKAFASDQEESELDEEDDPSITPIAIPLLAGPGSITTVMVLTAEAPERYGVLPVVLAVVAILAVTGAVLLGADLILRRFGQTGMRLMGKLMGLLVTVIAVQLIMNGAASFVRELMAG